MSATFRRIFAMFYQPRRAIEAPDFDQGNLWAWPLCRVPIFLALIATGLLDPAPGYAMDLRSALHYAGGAAIVCALSMGGDLIKAFLMMTAGGARPSLLGAVRKLLPLLCALSLLDAVWTLGLFALRASRIYPAMAQIWLFGQELLFAAGAGYALYARENATKKRSTVLFMLCFLALSAWLLLSVFFG